MMKMANMMMTGLPRGEDMCACVFSRFVSVHGSLE